ncbi:CP4-57 prophage protein [Escherichia coli]|uniref:CP4-57 prophage protein n=1 Tax=Escherichia coli TaxID=562 RepID=A0A376LH16_ECOLX|nr:CP4-57 prophage protein [Escherichia coli]
MPCSRWSCRHRHARRWHQAALTYRYGDEHQPVTTADILTPRRREDYGKDLWSAYQTIQREIC